MVLKGFIHLLHLFNCELPEGRRVFDGWLLNQQMIFIFFFLDSEPGTDIAQASQLACRGITITKTQVPSYLLPTTNNTGWYFRF
jgi:hypothetical protein